MHQGNKVTPSDPDNPLNKGKRVLQAEGKTEGSIQDSEQSRLRVKESMSGLDFKVNPSPISEENLKFSQT